MSPQLKPTIKELDGLPAGEIDLRIQQSEQRTKEFLENRLTVQDEKLDMMQNDLSALVGTKQITGLVQSVKTTIEGLVVKHDTWHAEDLTYRTELNTKVTTIETDTKRLRDQVQMIRWFVATSHGVSRCLGVGLKMLSETDFWKVFGAAALMWTLSHFAPGLWKEVAEYIQK